MPEPADLVPWLIANDVIIFAIVGFIGQKWIERKLAERLADHQHKLSLLYNRASQVQNKEFDLLHDVWEHLNEAYGQAYDVLKLIQPMLMPRYTTDDQVKEYLRDSKISEAAISELFRHRKNDDHEWQVQVADLVLKRRIEVAQRHLDAFHNYYILNRIFISEDLLSVLQQIDTVLRNSLEHRRTCIDVGETAIAVDIWREFEATQPMVDRVEQLIRTRLRFDAAE